MEKKTDVVEAKKSFVVNLSAEDKNLVEAIRKKTEFPVTITAVVSRAISDLYVKIKG